MSEQVMNEHDEAVLGAIKVHKIWHKFCKHMSKWYYKEVDDWELSDDLEIIKSGKLIKEFDPSKMIGYECMKRCEKYAKKNKEIKIIGVDDSVYASSVVILIPHPEHGITVIFVPQCTDVMNQFFLYSGHAHNIVSEIHKMNYKVDGRI